MNPLDEQGNITWLVFRRPEVDPDQVTEIPGLQPSETLRVGEIYPWYGGERVSDVGSWKLRLKPRHYYDRIEDQLEDWIQLLQPKADALRRLHDFGYGGYIDGKAASRSLSVCIEPAVLTALGELGLALDIWLYEQSPGDRKRA